MERVATGWVIDLPWTALPLSLNRKAATRGSRIAQWRTEQRVRSEVKALARAAKVPRLERAHIALTWYPPNRQRRDPLNMAATLKPAIDGLVDAGVVDDDDHTRVVDACRIGAVSTRKVNGRVVSRFTLTITDLGERQEA